MIYDNDSSSAPFSADDFLSKIIPSWLSFVVQLAAFLILLLVVILVAYKPVKKMIKAREDHIEQRIREAEENSIKSRANVLASEEAVNAGRKTANEIIGNAEKTASVRATEIISGAEKEADRLREEAKKDILRMEEDAREQIRAEMVDIALDASEELLKRNVTDDDNRRLVEEFVREEK